MKMEFVLENLDCASCAGKIEDGIKKLKYTKDASVSFAIKRLAIEVDETIKEEALINDIKKIVNKLEPDVIVKKRNNNNDLKISTESNCEDGNCTTEFVDKKFEDEQAKIKKERSLTIIKFVSALILFIIGAIVDFKEPYKFIIFFISYILVGFNVLKTAFRNILNGNIFDENFLMSIATIGAFAVRDYPEAVAVMLFYQVGEFFQSLAVDNSRRSIKSLMNIRPDSANFLLEDGTTKIVSPEQILVGNKILIKPGERIPLDGLVLEGNSMVDTSALTGESVPRSIKKGDKVLSGSINKSGILKVEVEKLFGDSTVSKILDLVENATAKKSNTENFITKFAKYYTPIVVVLAILIAVVPPLMFNYPFVDWLRRALVFLVVSCPCALVVSVPLGFFAGLGSASKHGILIKGGNYLEALSNVDAVVFDKTGTLTKGVFKVTEIKTYNNFTKEDILEKAAYVENYSTHPIAMSIKEEFGKEINQNIISEYKEIAGYGISAKISNEKILAGNLKLIEENNILLPELENIAGTVIHVAVDEKYAGYILISDEIKIDSKLAIQELHNLGVRRVVMLTGDNKEIADEVGKNLGIDKVYSELLPNHKVDKVEEILKTKKEKSNVVFVGDGINDAPVLARADIGVAMGGLGSDAAIEAADVVLMTDEPRKLVTAIDLSKYTNKIVKQNIIFALSAKGIVLILAAVGLANMRIGVFADVGVALLAILNSMRILKYKEKK